MEIQNMYTNEDSFGKEQSWGLIPSDFKTY